MIPVLLPMNQYPVNIDRLNPIKKFFVRILFIYLFKIKMPFYYQLHKFSYWLLNKTNHSYVICKNTETNKISQYDIGAYGAMIHATEYLVLENNKYLIPNEISISAANMILFIHSKSRLMAKEAIENFTNRKINDFQKQYDKWHLPEQKE